MNLHISETVSQFLLVILRIRARRGILIFLEIQLLDEFQGFATMTIETFDGLFVGIPNGYIYLGILTEFSIGTSLGIKLGISNGFPIGFRLTK